jgi:hypothetical protein
MSSGRGVILVGCLQSLAYSTLTWNTTFSSSATVRPRHAGVLGWTIDCIQQLKTTYDPQHVGVFTLVVERHMHGRLDKKNEEAKGQSAFLSTILNIQEVLF